MSENSSESEELLSVYRQHPLQLSTILKRAQLSQSSPRQMTELDLAFDEETQITDQNHIGGAELVRGLARLAGVTNKTRILDLGSGLGGPARLLAHDYGCSVIGIELSPSRWEAAQQLTKLVGLTHLVNFECNDLRTMPVPICNFDLLWAQNSLLHIRQRAPLFSRWAETLKPLGKFAIEDAYLVRIPRSSNETDSLVELEEFWLAHIGSLDAWKADLSAGGFRITNCTDLSEILVQWLSKLIRSSGRQPAPSREISGWERGYELGRTGILGYFRILAVKEPSGSTLST